MILRLVLAAMQATAAPSSASLAATGEKFLAAERLDEARQAFEAALRLDAVNVAALRGIGIIEFSQRRYRQARVWFEKAVHARPNSFQVRFLLGAVLVELNDPASAIDHLRVAHQLDATHPDVRKLLAAQYSATGQYRQAIALLASVVDTAPYDEEVHLLLIAARQASGDSEGVFALATRAERRFPRSAQVAAWLGFQLQFSGRYDEAEKKLRRAIDLEPSFGVPYQLLGEISLKREEHSDAIEWFRKAAGIMPGDVETLIGLGRALAALDKSEAALQALHSAARIAPKNAQVHLQLSRLYFRMGDEARAREEADLSVRLRTIAPVAVEAPAGLRMK
jgi:tetratricopeptide (TPR) repeat protein